MPWGRAASVPYTSATILSSTGRSPSKCYMAERARRRSRTDRPCRRQDGSPSFATPGIVAVHDVGVQEGHVYIVSLRQVRDDEPQPPRQLVGGIPPELETACLKVLAKRQQDRYTTAADFAADLRRVLQTTAEASGSRRMPVGTPARDSRVATPGTTGPGRISARALLVALAGQRLGWSAGPPR